MKILFVEDNRDLSTNLFDYFDARGHDIDLANEGLAGFELASTDQYDVIVLDWMLPNMDGLTICMRLRAIGKHTPILMLTARDSTQDKITGLEAGADDYVIKPFSMRNLEERILALVSGAAIKK
jgi:DNA-binding response OmpR family regulator